MPKVKIVVQMCVRGVLDSLEGRLEVVRASEMTDLDARSAVTGWCRGSRSAVLTVFNDLEARGASKLARASFEAPRASKSLKTVKTAERDPRHHPVTALRASRSVISEALTTSRRPSRLSSTPLTHI